MTAPRVVDPHERRQRGLELYREIMAREHPEPTTPRSATLIDFVFAEIWSRPGITRRERRLIAMSCAAGADAFGSLGDHFYAALKTDEFSIDELREFVLHFAVYCGWPKAESVERVLDEQWSQINEDNGSPTPPAQPHPVSSIPTDQELRKQGGEQEFEDVNWVPAPPRGVPYYDDGILNFVFGDMWKRPGLSRRDRRWITLACVGLDDTTTPIQSHVYSAMKSGDISFDEMREMVLQFAAHSGWPKGSFMQATVDEMHARILDESSGR
jgi:4-carboxymuconolactone decarboxylase